WLPASFGKARGRAAQTDPPRATLDGDRPGVQVRVARCRSVLPFRNVRLRVAIDGCHALGTPVQPAGSPLTMSHAPRCPPRAAAGASASSRGVEVEAPRLTSPRAERTPRASAGRFGHFAL